MAVLEVCGSNAFCRQSAASSIGSLMARDVLNPIVAALSPWEAWPWRRWSNAVVLGVARDVAMRVCTRERASPVIHFASSVLVESKLLERYDKRGLWHCMRGHCIRGRRIRGRDIQSRGHARRLHCGARAHRWQGASFNAGRWWAHAWPRHPPAQWPMWARSGRAHRSRGYRSMARSRRRSRHRPRSMRMTPECGLLDAIHRTQFDGRQLDAPSNQSGGSNNRR